MKAATDDHAIFTIGITWLPIPKMTKGKCINGELFNPLPNNKF